ncbi:hypothetical protein D0962_37210 [Leptolyngbyaceae cyanobacterium CCMR0082]|uniref:Uncharacterized protein n=1 Tax=Adonisia turfae CCMR0082 TaxID=2304604 RepID=A0A6M0SIA6_9CYAN|nr:hypothetical protein [Adonisia turfae]NEZ68308.1 hypothetical protein [Adonisia turfae CCMR0082]
MGALDNTLRAVRIAHHAAVDVVFRVTIMSIEFTAFDLDLEVGTFHYDVDSTPKVGDIIDGMEITNIRRWDAEGLELEADIEYV